MALFEPVKSLTAPWPAPGPPRKGQSQPGRHPDIVLWQILSLLSNGLQFVVLKIRSIIVDSVSAVCLDLFGCGSTFYMSPGILVLKYYSESNLYEIREYNLLQALCFLHQFQQREIQLRHDSRHTNVVSNSVLKDPFPEHHDFFLASQASCSFLASEQIAALYQRQTMMLPCTVKVVRLHEHHDFFLALHKTPAHSVMKNVATRALP